MIHQIKHRLPHRSILFSLASKFYNITRKMISQPAELVFVPSPGAGHLVSTVEMAKLLVARDSRLFITVLIIKYPIDSGSINSYSDSLLSSSSPSELERIKLIDLPETQTYGADFNILSLVSSFFENKKPLVRDAVSKLAESRSGRPGSPRLAGFVVDMFTTNMMDVADEFGVPSYVFFTSGAGLLTLTSHMLTLCDEHGIDTTDFKDKPDSELLVPGFSNPVPAKVLPDVLLDKAVTPFYHNHNRKIRDQSKGILVNTFMELEPTIIQSLTHGKYPPIYPVGPVLNLNNNQGGTDKKTDDIVTWLDKQPPSSVVFLCFGSKGCFCEEQVKEIAMALERSGVRFLWSLRRPPQKGKFDSPADYTDPNEVLPEGFLNRTAEIGKVIGWAPQTTVLAHPAVGGFLSHCGWNSTLESLWFGVPTATWSLCAEQQLNAFEMVVELGLAVEIKIDYRKDLGNDLDAVILRAEEIERGIRSLMQRDIEIRKRVKEMSEKSRKCLLNGGSSYSSLGRFIDDMMENMP